MLHNAAQVPVGHPRYDEARQVIQMAIDSLGNQADSASAKDIKDISPGPIGTALVAFGHGASLGLAGDPKYLELARQANPKTAFGADLAGTAATATIASPLVAGLSPVAGGALLGGGVSAIRGAVEPIPGMSRAESALVQGGVGAISGAVVGKAVSKLVPIARTVAANIRGLIGTSASPAESQAVTEAAVRAELTRLKVRPDVVERTVQAWKAASEPPASALRPGEFAQPIAGTEGRGIAVTGTRATPAAPKEPTILEMQEGPIGSRPGVEVQPVAQRGLTKAQYAYRQGVVNAAGQPTAPGATPGQGGAAQLQQLKLLLQMPNDQFEAAAHFFPKQVMDEMRAVRLQYHGPDGPKP